MLGFTNLMPLLDLRHVSKRTFLLFVYLDAFYLFIFFVCLKPRLMKLDEALQAPKVFSGQKSFFFRQLWGIKALSLTRSSVFEI